MRTKEVCAVHVEAEQDGSLAMKDSCGDIDAEMSRAASCIDKSVGLYRFDAIAFVETESTPAEGESFGPIAPPCAIDRTESIAPRRLFVGVRDGNEEHAFRLPSLLTLIVGERLARRKDDRVQTASIAFRSACQKAAPGVSR